MAAAAAALAAATTRGAMREHSACAAPQRVHHNSWRRAKHELAPPGAYRINLCRYAGLNSPPALKLVGNDNVYKHSTIHRLTRRLDALKPPPDRIVRCPADDGSKVMATLFYPSGHHVTIRVALSGCGGVTNGDLSREGRPWLDRQLERLTPEAPRGSALAG